MYCRTVLQIWDSICAWAIFLYYLVMIKPSALCSLILRAWNHCHNFLFDIFFVWYYVSLFRALFVLYCVLKCLEGAQLKISLQKQIRSWRLCAQWLNKWTLERDILRSDLNPSSNNILNICWMFLPWAN